VRICGSGVAEDGKEKKFDRSGGGDGEIEEGSLAVLGMTDYRTRMKIPQGLKPLPAEVLCRS
jgi:hypothetical protein